MQPFGFRSFTEIVGDEKSDQHQLQIWWSKRPKHCQRLDIKCTSEPAGLGFEWCGENTAHAVFRYLSQLRETGAVAAALPL